MTPRSARPFVRNPLLGMPAIARLKALPARERELIGGLLRDLASDATERADRCWRRHKAPMAAYWKAVAVYARHTARAITTDARRRKVVA